MAVSPSTDTLMPKLSPAAASEAVSFDCSDQAPRTPAAIVKMPVPSLSLSASTLSAPPPVSIAELKDVLPPPLPPKAREGAAA